MNLHAIDLDKNELEKSILQAFVPLKRLSLGHVEALCRYIKPEFFSAQQAIVAAGECDGQHIYLLTGAVQVRVVDGSHYVVEAESEQCEYPLVHAQPRLASLDAHSDCTIIRFDSEMLDTMVAWDQTVRYILLDLSSQRNCDADIGWMTTLLKSDLFYKVPPINVAEIFDRFEEVPVNKGDVVLRQGELGDCCYVIAKGTADVFQAADDREAQQYLASLGEGRCFGEDALVNNTVRNATIRMKTDGVLMRLHKQDFFRLLKSPPVQSLTLAEAREAIEAGAQWLDVRNEDEYRVAHCDGAHNIPLEIMQLKLRMLDKSVPYITYCNSGRRSHVAAHFMQEAGYTVHTLAGGFKRYTASHPQFCPAFCC